MALQRRPQARKLFRDRLEAWAAFANHDGTNIFASKESVADKAGISKWTVFRNTDDLVAAGALVEANIHTCKTQACAKGEWHYAGNGHYTRAHDIGLAELQNATLLKEKLGSKMLLGQGSKMPKSKVAKSHATQSLKDTQSPETRSALTSGEGRNEGMKEVPFAPLTTPAAPPEPVANSEPRKAIDQDGYPIFESLAPEPKAQAAMICDLWYDLLPSIRAWDNDRDAASYHRCGQITTLVRRFPPTLGRRVSI